MFIYFVIFIVFGVLICANLIAGILIKEILNVGNLNDAFVSSKKPQNETANSNHSNRPDNNHTVNITAINFIYDFVSVKTINILLERRIEFVFLAVIVVIVRDSFYCQLKKFRFFICDSDKFIRCNQ